MELLIACHCQGGPNGAAKCIDREKLCDGQNDCEDGQDEIGACCKYIFYIFSILPNPFFLELGYYWSSESEQPIGVDCTLVQCR